MYKRQEDLEGLAEDLHAALSPKDDIFAGLKAKLRAHSGIDTRILPTTILGADRSRYDRHSQRLLISEALSFEARIYEAAHLLARLEGKSLIEEATAKFSDKPEQQRLAKAALYDHLALALLAPRGRFNTASEDLKWDLTALSHRFALSSAHVMLRLAQVNDTFAFIAVDVSGRLLHSHGKLPFHLTKDEPLCAQLPLFDEGSGLHFATLSHTIAIAHQHSALIMPKTAFAASSYELAPKPRPFGSTCRLCDVQDCLKRSAAAATKPAGLNDYIRGPTVFEPI